LTLASRRLIAVRLIVTLTALVLCNTGRTDGIVMPERVYANTLGHPAVLPLSPTHTTPPTSAAPCLPDLTWYKPVGDIYTGVEEALGEYISTTRQATGKRPSMEIHTKFVPDLDVLPTLSAAHVRAVVVRSLNRLRVPALDMVQLHWWDWGVAGYRQAGLWLQDLVAEGLIRRIGVTNFDIEHLRELMDAGVVVESNQVQYNLLDRRVERDMGAFCQASDVQLLCYGGLLGGFLADKWVGADMPTEPLENRSLAKYLLIIEDAGGWLLFQDLLVGLQEISRHHQVTVSTIALRWLLDQPGVGAVIIGARNAKHVPSLQEVFTCALSKEDHIRIRALLQPLTVPPGPVYGLERQREGRHGSIMRYNCNQLGTPAHAEEFLRRYIAGRYRAHPERGSRDGVLAVDPLATRLRRRDVDEEVAWLHSMQEEAACFEVQALDSDQAVDMAVVGEDMSVALLEVASRRTWETDPGLYLNDGFDGVFYLYHHLHAPEGSRRNEKHLLGAILARLQALPGTLQAGMENLTRPPRLFTDNAAQICGPVSSFFGDLSNEFEAACSGDNQNGLYRLLQLAANEARAAVDSFHEFLIGTLAARSDGSLAVGRDAYMQYMRQHRLADAGPPGCVWDLCSTPEELLASGRRYFAETLVALEAAAKTIDPSRTWKQITKETIQAAHPSAEGLLGSYLDEISRARSHFVSSGLFAAESCLEGEHVQGLWTPPALRQFCPFGDFLNPEPWSQLKTGTLMLNPVPEDLDAAGKEEYLRAQDYTFISVVAPHEAYPGHHLQSLRAQESTRPVRKALVGTLFYEGWGLYVEELASETGFFAGGQSGTALTRLTQLRLRLWRCARVILDVSLHTGEPPSPSQNTQRLVLPPLSAPYGTITKRYCL